MGLGPLELQPYSPAMAFSPIKRGSATGIGGGTSSVKGLWPARPAGPDNIVPAGNRQHGDEALDRLVHQAMSNKMACARLTITPAIALLNPTDPHRMIHNSGGNHVVGSAHTNAVEGFSCVLKFGMKILAPRAVCSKFRVICARAGALC